MNDLTRLMRLAVLWAHAEYRLGLTIGRGDPTPTFLHRLERMRNLYCALLAEKRDLERRAAA